MPALVLSDALSSLGAGCSAVTDTVFRGWLRVEPTPLSVGLVLLAAVYALIVVASLLSRFTSKRGQLIQRRVATHCVDQRDEVELGSGAANPRKGRRLELDLACVSGDAVEVIVDEMFPPLERPHSYLKHGVVVPSRLAPDGKPALVVDVGANVGLFGMSMKYLCDVDVAERRRKLKNNVPATVAAVAAAAAATPARATSKAASGVSPSPKKAGGKRAASTAGRKPAAAAAAAAAAPPPPLPLAPAAGSDAENYVAPSVRVIGFEPIPETFECARRNMAAAFGASNARCVAAGRPQDASSVHRVGIGRKPDSLTFHYDPAFSAMASMAKAEISAIVSIAPLQLIGAVLQDARDFKTRRLYGRGILNDLVLRPFYWAVGAFGTLMRTPVVNLLGAVVLVPFAIAFVLWRVASMPTERTTRCDIEPLPLALQRAGAGDPLQSIALLKVDVEGAEEEVLLGMDDVTWRRVHQCVVEVHQTPDDRITRLVELLRAKGFANIHVDVEDLAMHQVCDLRTIFATRR